MGRQQDLLDDLSTRMRLAPPDHFGQVLHDVVFQHAGVDVDLYLVDYGQAVLHPLLRSGGPTHVQPVDSTLAGRAFQAAETLTSERGSDEHSAQVWLPVLNGAERVGVLAVTSAEHDQSLHQQWHRLARAVSAHLLRKGQIGDVFQRTARRKEMSLAAELQWQILPPLTAGTDRVTIAGALEPSYEVGGDSFDYAISSNRLQFAIFDAMGHGLGSSLISTVAVGAYRHARRLGLNLIEAADAIDGAISSQFGEERFATGLLAELDLTSGTLLWLNAGHPAPLLLRNGQIVKSLGSSPRLPFGFGEGLQPEVAHESLQPQDRVLLYTDGVVEARSDQGQEFGVERLGDLTARAAAAHVPAPEMMRRLTRAVLAHQQGVLQDDATQVIIEWHPAGCR